MPLNIKGNILSSTDVTSVGVFKSKVNRDGLMMYLDAGNKDSYPGSGTVWYDLSGNGYNGNMSNLTSANWVSYGGVMTFETSHVTDQNFKVSSFTFPSYNRTYEIWHNSKSYAIGWQSWFDDNNTERVLFGTSSNNIELYPGTVFTGGLVAGTWYHLAYTMFGSEQTAFGYKNGVIIGSGLYGGTLASGTGTLYILGDGQTEVTSGYTAIVRVYNRALNPFEIAENFQADRGRFGI